MFVCTFFRLYVCLSVCWICSPDRASFDTRVGHGKKRNSSAEVHIEKLTPSHQRFFLYERKRTQLSYLSTTFFLISFYNFFLQIFSNLTSLLIKSLTRYMLLYICSKYKGLIKSLTRYMLLYICNKYKRLIESLTLKIYL